MSAKREYLLERQIVVLSKAEADLLELRTMVSALLTKLETGMDALHQEALQAIRKKSSDRGEAMARAESLEAVRYLSEYRAVKAELARNT